MASPLQFGDADVKLNIIFRDGAKYAGNPLYVHSNVLIRKSPILQEKLSACRSSNGRPGPLEINVKVHDNIAEPYIKCIGLMYSSYIGEQICFSHADDAVDILQVAWEWQFEDGIRASMQYGVEVLLPELALTLGGGAHEIESLVILQQNLEKVMEQKANPQLQDDIMDVMKEYVVSNFDAESSPALRDMWGNLLLDKCRSSIDEIKCPAMAESRNSCCYFLVWTLNLIELCDGELFDAALGILADDAEFMELLVIERGADSDISGVSRLLGILDDKFAKDLIDKCSIGE